MSTALAALIRVVALSGAALMVVGITVWQTKLLDRQFIFFPERELSGTPGDVGLEYEDVFFSTDDGVRLHGWFVPGSSDTTLLWFHGNAGNISHRIDNLLMIHRRLEVNVFIFDYRGYGRSDGDVSEGGMYADAEAALDHLGSRAIGDPDLHNNLVLFGRSLGCAVAVDIATRRKVRGVILESPFTSVRAMVKRSYPYLPSGLLMQLVRARYDSLAKITHVDSPVMVLHGDRDETVPFDMGHELYDAANEPKRFYTIEGAAHNDTFIVGGAPYYEALRKFVEDPTGRPD